jgi:hypothetical protein
MTIDPGQEGPNDGKAFAEPEGVPKIVEAALTPAHDEAPRGELDQTEGFGRHLTRYQHDVLNDLLRLHRSLRGPQTLLETAGNLGRPPFPPPSRIFG